MEETAVKDSEPISHENVNFNTTEEQENTAESSISMSSAINSKNTIEQQLNTSSQIELHRAKAFILNSESNDWDEMATGICSPEPSEDGEVFAIRLRAEEDTSLVLFTAYFHKSQEIGVQNDTVLTWTTLDGVEAALSFESSVGCEEFWKLICRFYGKSFEEWKLNKKHGTDGSVKAIDNFDDEDPELSNGKDAQSQSHENTNLFKNEEEDDEEMDDGFYDYMNDNFDGSAQQLPKVEIALPEKPEISTLSEIEAGLNQSFLIPSLRRQICEVIIQYQYISILLEIFQNCEEFGMISELQQIFRIFKLFFLLNGQEVLKELMAEDNYLRVASVMEYDPILGVIEPKANIYRTFLSEGDRFKQVIPLNNSDIISLIHQTFRLQYFKDVILSRILDEESSASFILLIRLNHMAIINSIDNDPEVIEVIRSLLQNSEMPLNDQINVMNFFKEFLTIAKTVTLRKSLQIHQVSVVNDFMKFITRVLNTNYSSSSGEGYDIQMINAESSGTSAEPLNNYQPSQYSESKILAIGLFTNFIQHDPSQIRNYLIQNDNDSYCIPKNLLNTIIDMFTDPETCSPIRWQLVSALKILLDTFIPSTPSISIVGNNPHLSAHAVGQALAQKVGEGFLNHFYPDYAGRLLRPLIDFDKTVFLLNDPGSGYFLNQNLSESSSEILFHLGELLCNFIGNHKYRIKYLILRNLILQNTLLLLKCREKHLQLTGLRIFRSTLACEDEFYYRFFIQHRSFGSIFKLYSESGGCECDNLVTSSILEIFEFIRIPRDSLKAVVRHLSTVYRTELESFGPQCVFRGILETEDRIDRESSIVSFASSSQTSLQSDQEMMISARVSRGESMTEEEDYFSESAEDMESNTFNSDQEALEQESSRFTLIDEDDETIFKSSKEDEEDEEEDHFELLLKKASSSPNFIAKN